MKNANKYLCIVAGIVCIIAMLNFNCLFDHSTNPPTVSGCTGTTLSENFDRFDIVPNSGGDFGGEHEWHIFSSGATYWRNSSWDACGKYHYRFTNISHAGAMISLNYKRKNNDPQEYYTGSEIWTCFNNNNAEYVEYSYGSFEAKMKVAKGSGIVNAFFLYKDVNPDLNIEENKEIDIEIMGKGETNLIKFTCWTGRNLGQETPVWFNTHDIGISDLSLDFHKYRFDWNPEQVKFYIDDRYTGITITSNVPQIPLYMACSIWLCDHCSNPPNLCDWNLLYQVPGYPEDGSNNSGSLLLYDICISSSINVNDIPPCDSVPPCFALGTVLYGMQANGSEGDISCYSDVFPEHGIRISPGGGSGRAIYKFGPVSQNHVNVSFQWEDNAWWSDLKTLDIWNWNTCVWNQVASWNGNDGTVHNDTYGIDMAADHRGPDNQIRISLYGAPNSVIHLNTITAY